MSWTRYIINALRLRKHREIRKAIESREPKHELEKHFSEDERGKIKTLQHKLDQCEETNKGLKKTNKDLSYLVENLEEKIDDLENRLAVDDHPKKEHWNNKYKRKLVEYRRQIWTGNELDFYSVPVTNFITPNDLVIKAHVENEDLKVEDPMNINEDVPKIYEYARRNYNYEYDSKSLGYAEYWQFPFETRINDGDCEDWSHVIASYLIAAGVPSWRVKVVAGGTLDDNYGGHATVYVLDDSLETWRHLNSTSPSYSYDNLTEYPKWGEDTGLNIDPNDVWVAFNDKYGWQQFESADSKKRFEDHKISDKLVTK